MPASARSAAVGVVLLALAAGAVELSALSPLVGRWKCGGAEWVLAPSKVDGWLDGTMAGDAGWSSAFGVDTKVKGLLRSDFLPSGEVIHASSSGWKGEQLVWEGQRIGLEGATPFREVVKKGEKKLTLVQQRGGADGGWADTLALECKPSKK